MLARLIAELIHDVRTELRKLEPSALAPEPDTHRYDPASVTSIDTERAPSWDHDKRAPVTGARFGFGPQP